MVESDPALLMVHIIDDDRGGGGVEYPRERSFSCGDRFCKSLGGGQTGHLKPLRGGHGPKCPPGSTLGESVVEGGGHYRIWQ